MIKISFYLFFNGRQCLCHFHGIFCQGSMEMTPGRTLGHYLSPIVHLSVNRLGTSGSCQIHIFPLWNNTFDMHTSCALANSWRGQTCPPPSVCMVLTWLSPINYLMSTSTITSVPLSLRVDLPVAKTVDVSTCTKLSEFGALISRSPSETFCKCPSFSSA